jgi:hypothetical protein
MNRNFQHLCKFRLDRQYLGMRKRRMRIWNQSISTKRLIYIYMVINVDHSTIPLLPLLEYELYRSTISRG